MGTKYSNVCHAKTSMIPWSIEYNVKEGYDLPRDKPHIDSIENYVVDDRVQGSGAILVTNTLLPYQCCDLLRHFSTAPNQEIYE
jgi:hypothetical protein